MYPCVCVAVTINPFTYRAFITPPPSFPISTHGVTVLLFKTICKNVQIKMETENSVEGIETRQMRCCSPQFPEDLRGLPGNPTFGVGFQGREATGPGGCFCFGFSGCFSDDHECLLGTLCLKRFGPFSEMHFLKSKSKSSKCEGEGYRERSTETRSGGGFNCLSRALSPGPWVVLLPHRCLCVLSAKQGGFRAPGAPSHLGHPAAILGKS